MASSKTLTVSWQDLDFAIRSIRADAPKPKLDVWPSGGFKGSLESPTERPFLLADRKVGEPNIQLQNVFCQEYCTDEARQQIRLLQMVGDLEKRLFALNGLRGDADGLLGDLDAFRVKFPSNLSQERKMLRWADRDTTMQNIAACQPVLPNEDLVIYADARHKTKVKQREFTEEKVKKFLALREELRDTRNMSLCAASNRVSEVGPVSTKNMKHVIRSGSSVSSFEGDINVGQRRYSDRVSSEVDLITNKTVAGEVTSSSASTAKVVMTTSSEVGSTSSTDGTTVSGSSSEGASHEGKKTVAKKKTIAKKKKTVKK